MPRAWTSCGGTRRWPSCPMPRSSAETPRVRRQRPRPSPDPGQPPAVALAFPWAPFPRPACPPLAPLPVSPLAPLPLPFAPLSSLARLSGLVPTSTVLSPVLVFVGISAATGAGAFTAGMRRGLADKAPLLLDRESCMHELAGDPSGALPRRPEVTRLGPCGHGAG